MGQIQLLFCSNTIEIAVLYQLKLCVTNPADAVLVCFADCKSPDRLVLIMRIEVSFWME